MTTPYDWAEDDWAEDTEQQRERDRRDRDGDRDRRDRRDGDRRDGTKAGGAQPGRDGSTRGGGRDQVYDVTGRTAWENRENRGKGDDRNRGSGNREERGSSGGGAADRRHQGDRLIHAVERIEFASERDVYKLAKAINHLGRELHLILGMRAEELQAVLGTYKGKWYTFGGSSKVKARLVAAHLKVSAEAAKALGVGALKMSHAFHRHFVLPEQEAKHARSGRKPTKRAFTIGDG